MIRAVALYYVLVLIVMGIATYQASLQRNILDMWTIIAADKWFIVTLWDTYFSFIAIAGWIIYRERNQWVGLGIFVLIMVGGNFTIALYVLWALYTLKPGTGIKGLLLGANY
ncbi:hypothetical protein COTS27_01327 [Spirochaetota bacterium]|nr:hypothetical protein COTS27_01327 [Spirochaetota bacterium]